MKPSWIIVIALAVVGGTACGGGETAADPEVPDVDASAKMDAKSSAPTEDLAAAVIMPYYQFRVELVNDSSDERLCSITYSYHDWDGSVVNGPQTPPVLLAHGQSFSTTASVPLNQVVALAVGCQHPQYPCLPGYTCSDVYAAASLRTDPMRDHITYHASYTEAGTTRTMTLQRQ